VKTLCSPELRALRHGAANLAADDGADNRTQQRPDLVFRRLAGLRRAVPQRDVAELVAITLTTAPSVCAASIIPRLRYIGPPQLLCAPRKQPTVLKRTDMRLRRC
jgi:hypothetical protein